jgi:CBS domain-containing protein
MKVKDIMTVEPACCVPDTTLGEVARLMVEHDCGEIPVVQSNGVMKPVGVITDRDIVCRTVAQQLNPLEMTAADCMTNGCLTVPEDAGIDACCDLLEQNQVRRMLVVDATGALCGIVAQADIARSMSGRKTAEVVREVSQPRAPQPSAL